MVGMKRTIFVRPLSDAEREALEDGLRSYDAFVLRRCQILLASARGENAYQIAHSLGYDPQAARTAIKRFNEGGLREALHERSSRPMMWRLRSVICLTPSYPRGPFFGVFTLWESSMAALGAAPVLPLSLAAHAARRGPSARSHPDANGDGNSGPCLRAGTRAVSCATGSRCARNT